MRVLPADSPLRAAAAEVGSRIDALLAPFVPWHRRAVEPKEGDFYEWYYACGMILRPKVFLEIGVLGGGSAVAVCLGAAGAVGEVHLIDDESHDRPAPLSDAEDAVRLASPLTSVRSYREDSQRMARLPHGPSLDIVSIDADHRVGPCYHDLRISLPRLAPGGHVLVDDASWGWVRDACDAFAAAHPELEDLFVGTRTGMRIFHHRGEHLAGCPLLAGGVA